MRQKSGLPQPPFNPDGQHLGVIVVPEVVANLTWGGPQWNDLYLTASTSLFSVHTKVSSNRLAYM